MASELKLDCPHVHNLLAQKQYFLNVIQALIQQDYSKSPRGECVLCEASAETMCCFECGDIFCSTGNRSGHALHHFKSEREYSMREADNFAHACSISLSSGNVWCFECDSEIDSPAVRSLKALLEIIRSEDRPTEDFSTAINDVFLAAVKALDTDPLTFDKLIDGMRLKKYNRIVFLTGAGISVASGIPDFRTPGSGLYAKVEAMGLSKPEAIFSIDYFRESPETFYTLAGSLMFHDAKPVKAHKFIKKVADEGLLLKCMTQNIDGLELDAGLDPSHLIQAHGHMRSARCCNCRIAVDIADFHKHIHEQKVLRCSKVGCPGIVKPDVTFFGEALPESFGTQVYLVRRADLVIVMGTSLSVHPFAKVLSLVSLSTPIVLINMENPGIIRPNFLFMPGCIEDGVQKICDGLNWKLDNKRTLDEQRDNEEQNGVGGEGGGSAAAAAEVSDA